MNDKKADKVFQYAENILSQLSKVQDNLNELQKSFLAITVFIGVIMMILAFVLNYMFQFNQ